MTWAQRLKRMFAIEIEKCEECGGEVKAIASIEDPDVIEKILKHLETVEQLLIIFPLAFYSAGPHRLSNRPDIQQIHSNLPSTHKTHSL